MMDDLFDEVLALCLDRLADGDDVDACVIDFPECPDLRPLLEIAQALAASGPRAVGQPSTGGDPSGIMFLEPRRRLRPTA